MSEVNVALRPGLFCRYLLKALDAADGQTRRRKRDQAPDRLGLQIKRDLLERAVADDPEPAAFEGWLVAQISAAPAGGPVRAMCEQIFLEYRAASLQPEFSEWLLAGAPSDDAEPDGQGNARERARAHNNHNHNHKGDDRWQGLDEQVYACTCHLPLG